MNILQDIMGLIAKRKVNPPTDKDYLVVASYTDTQEILKPQPKMQANLVSIGALKKFVQPNITPTYKVFTALLTQSGGDSYASLNYDDVPGGPSLSIGTTYVIEDNADGLDMTNVGAPNNNVGTYFIATGTTPASWGFGILGYNTGAPVATVLENTIGNVWFTYNGVGSYIINSNGLFIQNKSWTPTILIYNDSSLRRDGHIVEILYNDENSYYIVTFDQSGVNGNDWLNSTPIEIRVYN